MQGVRGSSPLSSTRQDRAFRISKVAMDNYKGTIIEESLEDMKVLKKLNITATRVETITDEHQTPWLTQWTLHAVEIPEGEARQIAEELSQSLDRAHGGAWYADFRNKTHHYVIYRDKVFCLDRTSKGQYDAARQHGLSLGIPAYQLVNYWDLPLDVLAQFLKEANKSGYANIKAKKAPSTRPGSKDYHFDKGNLIYHDTYFGSRDFIGETIVYKHSFPIWGSNYFGFVLDEKIDKEDLYDFLRKALLQEQDGLLPVRGPSDFSCGNWHYRFSASGDLANFSGQEEISLDDKIVYRCLIHGGFIK